MNLEQHVTSLELSKRLKELGVRKETLLHWVYGDGFKPTLHFHDEMTTYEQAAHAPAFLASELGEMLPKHACVFDFNDNEWRARELMRDGQGVSNTEPDSRAKLLIHLIESGVIKASDL